MVEFVLHVPTLRVPYHGTFLIVPLFFLVGVLLGEMGKLDLRAAAAIAALIVALPFAGQFFLRTLPTWPPLFLLAAAILLARGPWRQAALLVLLFLAPCMDRSVGDMWTAPPGAICEPCARC